MAKKAKPKTESVKIPEGKIKVLVEKNPRVPGTRAHRIFNLYKTGMSVEAFLSAGGGRGDLRWDLKRQHISVSAAEPTAKKAAAR